MFTLPALAAEWDVDAWMVICGLIAVSLRWTLQGFNIRTEECVVSIFNGATVVPFFVLVASAFSPAMLDLAMQSKGATAIAGAAGIFFVVGEIISPRDLRRRASNSATAEQSESDA